MAQSRVRQGVSLVIALSVTALMVAFVLTVGIEEIVAVDTSNWSSGAAALFNIFDLILVLIVAIAMFGWALDVF